VLCPEELCLAPVKVMAAFGVSPPADGNLSVCAAEDVDKGARFLPWKGTVRSDKLAVFDKLPHFDVSQAIH